jgi:hypothetical protein
MRELGRQILRATVRWLELSGAASMALIGEIPGDSIAPSTGFPTSGADHRTVDRLAPEDVDLRFAVIAQRLQRDIEW